jgi:hypothetical protein
MGHSTFSSSDVLFEKFRKDKVEGQFFFSCSNAIPTTSPSIAMQHKLLLIVSFALVLATIPVVVGESLAVQQLFEQFKIEHGKYYADPKEEAFRLGVFQVINVRCHLFISDLQLTYTVNIRITNYFNQQNMKEAEDMNKQNPNALFGVTQFMDLTDDEFAKIQGTSEDFDSNSNVTILNDTSLPSFYQLPDNFEW